MMKSPLKTSIEETQKFDLDIQTNVSIGYDASKIPF